MNIDLERYRYISLCKNETIFKEKLLSFFKNLKDEVKRASSRSSIPENKYNYLDDKLSDDIYEEKAQKLLEKTDINLNNKLSDVIKQVDEKTNSLTTNILTVLGIFVAIIVVFISAYLSIILPEARGGLAGHPIFVHLLYYAFVGHILFNLLFFLMFMISRLSHKNLSLACYGCPENEYGVIVCKNERCTMRTRAWRKYPYVVFANIMFISSYAIFFLAWYIEKILTQHGEQSAEFFLSLDNWYMVLILVVGLFCVIFFCFVIPFIFKPNNNYKRISGKGYYRKRDYNKLIEVFQQQLRDKKLIRDGKIKEDEWVTIIKLKNGFCLFDPHKKENRYIDLSPDYRALYEQMKKFIENYYTDLYKDKNNNVTSDVKNKIQDIIINIRKNCRS